MFSVYQKIYPLYDLEAYRVSAILLYHLVGLEVWRNAERANILRANEGLIDPAPIIAGALSRIDPELVFSIGFVPAEIAYHKNRRWSFCGRDVMTNSEIKSDISLYATVLKQTTKGTFIMASKLSQFKPTANKISAFVGQVITFLSVEFTPNRFNAEEEQAKARIMLEDGTTEYAYCTPYISRVMQQVEEAKAFPLVAMITSIPPRQRGQSMGYGLDDESIAPAKVKKLETMAKALKNAKAPTQKAEQAPPQKTKNYVEELDQKTGKWKKVKQGSEATAPEKKRARKATK